MEIKYNSSTAGEKSKLHTWYTKSWLGQINVDDGFVEQTEEVGIDILARDHYGIVAGFLGVPTAGWRSAPAYSL